MAKEMNAGNGAEKKGFGARFMNWYGSYQGKRVVGVVYSVGASIVIIGALFKIMHFPGAGAVLMVGMITEALLFMIGCLDKPHPEFHWHEVFPQLLGHGTEPHLLEEMQSRPKPTLMGGETTEVSSMKPKSQKMSVPALNDKDMESLKNGIADLAKTAGQLSELGKVAIVSNNLSDKLDAASQAAVQFVDAGKTIAEKSENLGAVYAQVANDMQKVAANTKDYEMKVASVVKQLNGLNAVYELQVNAVQAQVEAYKSQTVKVGDVNQQIDALNSSVRKMTDMAVESLKTQEAYEIAAKKLVNQVTDLNKIYGNMLNALS